MKEEHPLNILVAQTDTSNKEQNTKAEKKDSGLGERKYAQQAIRTFERDVDRKMYESKNSGKPLDKKELRRLEEEKKKETEKMEELAKREEKLKIEEMRKAREEEEKKLELLKSTGIARREQIERMQGQAVVENEIANKDAQRNEEMMAQDMERKRREDALVAESLARKAEIEKKEAEIRQREEEIKKSLKSNIRTYEGDVANMVKENKASKASMFFAESKRREEERLKIGGSEGDIIGSRKSVAKKIFLSVAGIIFIVAGAYGGYYFYSKSPLAKPPVVIKEAVVKSIISPDTQKTLSIDNLSEKDILSAISNDLNNNKNGVGKINELIPTIKNGESVQYVSGADFMKKVGVDLPSPLARSLANKMMLGNVKDDSGRSRVFVILTTNFFQNSYAGMLSFEKDMPNEFEYLMNYKSMVDDINDTASTSINNYFGIRGNFIDKQVKNRDVREFVHESGNIFFVYSFIDKNTLVITESESALSKIVEKIEKQTYIR